MTGPFSRTASIYDRGLAPDPANHVPLSPLSFLKRAAKVYPGKPAILHGRRTITYARFLDRVRRFAGALLQAGVGRGDTVSVLAGLSPKTALVLEDDQSKWHLVWAVRKDRAEDPAIKRFIELYRSAEVRDFINTRFNGTIIPTW